MMLTSAMSNRVKMAANIQKVTITDEEGIWLIAALRGNRSWTVQG